MKFLKIFERRPSPGFDYGAWIEAAELELATKQAALEDDYSLGHWQRWNSDLARGKLYFSDEERVKLALNVQIVGTTSAANWMWAWANAHLPEEFCEDSALAKAFGDGNRIAELADTHVSACDLDALGWRLTAAVVRLSEALGAYRAPAGAGAVFLAITAITPLEAA